MSDSTENRSIVARVARGVAGGAGTVAKTGFSAFWATLTNGIIMRMMISIGLVLSVYNPTGHSYYHWVLQNWAMINEMPQSLLAVMVALGLFYLVALVVYLRALRRSIGIIGAIIAGAVFAAVTYLVISFGLDYGYLKGDTQSIVMQMINWLAPIFIGFILAVGLSWSIIRRWLTGQRDVDDVGDE